jgi:hypothetical protein
VLGQHQSDRHMGNAIVTDLSDLRGMMTPKTVHLGSLDGLVPDMAGYMTTDSDIVALLVVAHQAHMMNLITRIGWEARIGAADIGHPLAQTAAELVDYMLFVDEAPMPGSITGPSRFAKVFVSQGPRDSKGRSLRDIDLTQDRLMRYPCSYLIYSEAFDTLPATARDAIYARMWEVLSGRDSSKRYERLTGNDRQAIVEILRDTKRDLPEYFGRRTDG